MKQSAFQVFCVTEIRPNPFRAIERYPLDEKKIKALRESIRATSFWDNLVARIGEDGKPEIAYGHHRLEALRQEVGDDAEVRLIIRELDDTMMLKMMLRENMEEWQTNALVDQASIRAVVDAHADGKVPLPPPKPKTPQAKLRYAPGFRQGGDVPGGNREHPYTTVTVADFLGWDRTKVETTLAALELIERKLVAEDMYDGLTQSKAGVLTTEVRKVVCANDAKAKELEKQADTARRRAKEAETKKERAAQEKLAESALQEAAAVRKRRAEQADHVAWTVMCALQDDAVSQGVSAQLEGLHKPPPLPRSRDKEPVDEIAEYLDRLPEYTAHVQQVRAQVERFIPEQIEKVFNGGGALQQELAALETDLKAVVRERQKRGSARIKRSGKEKKNQPRRYGVTAKRRPRSAKAHV